MSTDTQQVRKRKDKRKKKDDIYDQTLYQTYLPSGQFPLNEDSNIHVHKEGETGGGICAKLIFFILFAALIVLIGLIITEYRGLSDLDSELDSKSSQFSKIFEGWTDSKNNNLEPHGSEEDTQKHEESVYDVEHEILDEAGESVEEEISEENVENEESLEQAEDEASIEHAGDEENKEYEGNESEENEESNSVPESEEEDRSEGINEDDEEHTVLSDEEKDQSDEDGEQQAEENEEDEIDVLQEDNKNGINDSIEDDDTSKENKEPEDTSTETLENSLHQGNEDEEIDEIIDPIEQEGEEQVVTEPATEDDEIKDGNNNGDNLNNINMAVKIGVGVALLVVAHVVLVRKWNTAPSNSTNVQSNDGENAKKDLSRRNTLVEPPTLEQIKSDIEEVQDLSGNAHDRESDEEYDRKHIFKNKYQELRSTYLEDKSDEGNYTQTKNDEDLLISAVKDYLAEDEEEEEEEEEEEDSEIGEGDYLGDEGVDEEEEEEEEEDEEEEEEESEDDDELMKRLEAKYGKLQQENTNTKSFSHDSDEAKKEDSDNQSDDLGEYGYENIVADEDLKIKEQIDEAKTFIKDNPAYALKLFNALLKSHPNSPRCLYGRSQALDFMADERKSNQLLKKAINTYKKILELAYVPDILFRKSAERCINRTRFLGNYNVAIEVHKALIERFPNEVEYKHALVVSYLTINRMADAKNLCKKILSVSPKDGFALVHYGFILKIAENKLEESVVFLSQGIGTKDEAAIDGRFFFHLGDALTRLNRKPEAYQVYEEGVRHKLFRSKQQRSLYNVNHLRAQPWWEKSETPYSALYAALEQNWRQIRDEGVAVLNANTHLFQDEAENLRDTGDWRQYELYARGRRNHDHCQRCPMTCRIIESVPAARGCRRGQVKFSVMEPATHVWPHCGPTNCRLRVHLGLSVPSSTYIRVGDSVRSWENGKVLIFDDSFEHEVWHNGTEFRLVLIVDVWHPDLSASDIETLPAI